VTEFGLQCVVAFLLVVVATMAGLYGWATYVFRQDLKKFEGDANE